MTWDDEVIAELLDLQSQKCSASEMSRALWEKFNQFASRSAVIGKLNRLNAGPVRVYDT